MSERFKVELSKRALTQLENYPAAAKSIEVALKKLKTNPESGHLLAGSLVGFRSIELNVKGSGAFRIAYVF